MVWASHPSGPHHWVFRQCLLGSRVAVLLAMGAPPSLRGIWVLGVSFRWPGGYSLPSPTIIPDPYRSVNPKACLSGLDGYA